MKTIYTAGPYSQREALKRWVDGIVSVLPDLTSTATWLNGTHDVADGMTFSPHNREAIQEFARADLEDIARSDIFVLQTAMPMNNPTNGRSVEFGFALGIGVPDILVVGYGEESIFHMLGFYEWAPGLSESRIFHLLSLAYAEPILRDILADGGDE